MAAKTPEDVDRLFGEHLNAGALESLAALYEPEAALVNQDGSTAHGPAEIGTALASIIALRPRIRMNVVKTVHIGDSLAALYNDWTMSATSPDGDLIEIAGKALEIVRRQSDGTWMFLLDDPFARG